MEQKMNWSKGKTMPDISLCFGKECPLKTNCFRYRAIPNAFMQSYLSEPPYKDGECRHFMDANKWPTHCKRNVEECEKDES